MNHDFTQAKRLTRKREGRSGRSQLRGALRNATSLFGERRQRRLRVLTNWEELRTQARAIKDEVLLHLDQYLEEFVAQC